MSATIVETLFDSGNDKAIDITTGEFTRKMAMGNNWTSSIVAITFQIAGVTNPAVNCYTYNLGGMGFGIGLTTDNDKISDGNANFAILGSPYGNAGVLDAVTSTRVWSGGTTDTMGVLANIWATGSFVGYNLGTTDSVGWEPQSSGSSYRGTFAIQFYKIDANQMGVRSYWNHYNSVTFDALETGALLNGLLSQNTTAFSTATATTNETIGTDYIYYDEDVFGPLDTVSIVWPYASHVLRLHHVAVAKWA